jgi:hypothetical protein
MFAHRRPPLARRRCHDLFRKESWSARIRRPVRATARRPFVSYRAPFEKWPRPSYDSELMPRRDAHWWSEQATATVDAADEVLGELRLVSIRGIARFSEEVNHHLWAHLARVAAVLAVLQGETPKEILEQASAVAPTDDEWREELLPAIEAEAAQFTPESGAEGE